MKVYDYSVLCRDADRETPPRACQIEGEIPSWIEGTVLYNGPGKLSLGEHQKFLHVFDGLALLQRYKISKGKVVYDSKFLQSYVYKEFTESNAITRSGFATPGPEKSFFSRLTSTADSDKMYSDNANLAIFAIGKRYIVTAEVPIIFEVDTESLEVIDRVNLNKEFGIVMHSVHFIEDNGSFYTIGQTFGIAGSKYVIIEIPSCGTLRKMKIVSSMPTKYRYHPSHVHAMTLSENYALFLEHSFILSMGDLVKDIFTNTPFISSVQWTGEKTVLRILDKKTWKPISQQFVTKAMFSMHFSNMYEEDGNLIFETPCYKNGGLIYNFSIDHLNKPKEQMTEEEDGRFYCKLQRFVVPLNMKLGENKENILGLNCNAKTEKKEILLEPDIISNQAIEHPVINPKYKGKKHRYIYGTGFPESDMNCGFMVKIDLETKEHTIYHKEFYHVNSTVFVPHPDGIDEDDGVVIANCLRADKNTCAQIVFFNAKDISVLAVASVDSNGPVPIPMHASYIS